MSWLLNIFLIVFIVGMAIYWSTQGVFSAILHLAITIASSVLAVAIWEPLVVWLLLDKLPAYAWGLGLLLPFVLFLIAIRKISDKLIVSDLHVPNIVNIVAGGCFGALSGVLTGGMLLLGISFLPFSTAILGYQAYGFGPKGQVQHTEQHLIIPVESITSSFLQYLSHGAGLTGGAFSTSTPLALDLPDIAKQSGMYRLREDANASLAATPSSVSITSTYKAGDIGSSKKKSSVSLPTNIKEALGYSGGDSLYIVDTKWHMQEGVYDRDHTLRLTRAQVHLITKSVDDSGALGHLVEPVGWSIVTDKNSGARTLLAFTKNRLSAYIVDDKVTTGWIFIVPSGQRPKFLEIRRLRLGLPAKPKTSKKSILVALGKPYQPPKKNGSKKGSSVGKKKGYTVGSVANAIKQTNSLPDAFRKSMATGLKYKKHAVTGGKGTTKNKRGGVGQRTVVRELYCPSQKAMIRLEVTADQAESFFGRAMAAAANVSPPLLHDSSGDVIAPSAYVWVKNSGKNMTIDYPFAPFQSSKQIPFNMMKNGDKIYLYFMVNHGTNITKYSLSSDMHQSINMHVQ